VVSYDRAVLEEHLVPFARAAEAGIPALMTAHFVVRALDPDAPATLSPRTATDLRAHIGFRGVLFTDDLEMRAIRDHVGVGEAAVRAIAAGCDAVLVCANEELQEEAYEALVARAEADVAFRARCEEAAGRCLEMRRRVAPRPVLDQAALARVFEASRDVAELVARGGT
jgi:beta-N-acetylhexosaminidase